LTGTDLDYIVPLNNLTGHQQHRPSADALEM